MRDLSSRGVGFGETVFGAGSPELRAEREHLVLWWMHHLSLMNLYHSQVRQGSNLEVRQSSGND